MGRYRNNAEMRFNKNEDLSEHASLWDKIGSDCNDGENR